MASPGKQEVCQRMERRHQDWRRGEFKELARERRRLIWGEWAGSEMGQSDWESLVKDNL